MRNPILKKLRFVLSVPILFCILGVQHIELGSENSFFHGYAIRKPVIRIGLGVHLDEIDVRASSEMKIYEARSNYKLIADDAGKVSIQGQRKKLPEKFIILVHETGDREEAEIFAQDLRTRIDNKVTVALGREEETPGIFQVKVGDFRTREHALHGIRKLQEIGLENLWIIQEKITDSRKAPVWIQIDGAVRSLNPKTVLYFIPSRPHSFLSFQEKSYRGIFLLKSSPEGLVLVNILHVEDYLKSVVPSELSPSSFPALEALKAQAVAARTYALKNLGTNGDLDFDLTDTPEAQFYQGIHAEHPKSSEAVEQTRGEVVLYKGKLVNALYTSSCGGSTENVEEVFEGPSLPYLRRTVCEYEVQRAPAFFAYNADLSSLISVEDAESQRKILSSFPDGTPSSGFQPASVFLSPNESGNVLQNLSMTETDRGEAQKSFWKSWEIRVSREKLSQRINRVYPVGELKDIMPLRRGKSWRVVELLISGTEGKAVVNGFRIRKILGLKDTLFVIQRNFDEKGKISQFVFSGKGWGHGVGLCQVGAFGMAQSGASYEEILKNYYQGITISKIY